MNLRDTEKTDDVLPEFNDETDLETKEEFKSTDSYLLLTDVCQANNNERTFFLNLKKISRNYDVLLMYFLVSLFYYVTYFTFGYYLYLSKLN